MRKLMEPEGLWLHNLKIGICPRIGPGEPVRKDRIAGLVMSSTCDCCLSSLLCLPGCMQLVRMVCCRGHQVFRAARRFLLLPECDAVEYVPHASNNHAPPRMQRGLLGADDLGTRMPAPLLQQDGAASSQHSNPHDRLLQSAVRDGSPQPSAVSSSPLSPGRRSDAPASLDSSAIDINFCRNAWQLLSLASGVAQEPIIVGCISRPLRPFLAFLLLGTVQVYNFCGFLSVLVPSLFYGALTSDGGGDGSHSKDASDAIDTSQLKDALKTSAVYLSLTVLAKALMTLVTEYAALQWRESLTQQLLA